MNSNIKFPENPPVPRHSHHPGPIAFAALVFFLALGGIGFLSQSQRILVQSHRIDEVARKTCEAGNERSDLQRTTFVESRTRTEAFDFRAILNLPEPQRSQDAERLKRESLEATDRNIASLPYLNCETGERVKRSSSSN